MNKNKLMLYGGVGLLVVAGGYFIYRQMISESAKTSLAGLLSGFGEKGLKMVGFNVEKSQLGGRADAQSFQTDMKGRKSPTPPHSPATLPPPAGLGGFSKSNIHAGGTVQAKAGGQVKQSPFQALAPITRRAQGITKQISHMAKPKHRSKPIAKVSIPKRRSRYRPTPRRRSTRSRRRGSGGSRRMRF